MNINIKTTDIALTPAIADYTNRRLEKIAHLLANDTTVQCDVELAKTTSHHFKGEIFKAEIHIVGAGRNCYASAEKEDLYAAIDIVQEEMVRELNSDKKKRTSLIRRGGARIKNMIRGFWPSK